MTDKRVALITGAGSGIGRAAAIAFAASGYHVIAADRDAPGGDETVNSIRDRAGTSSFIVCDVSNEESIRSLFAQIVAECGRLDAAFNNAGIEGLQANTADCTSENFDQVIAVNLRGVWLCMREEIRQMLKQEHGGAIVNCSSVAGLIGLPAIPAYAASKHGVIGLTRTAALEYAKQGIRVNAVCPGAVETPMLQRFMGTSPEGRTAMVASEPIGRIGRPDEIADAVLWLCERATFVTGQAIAVDGGWTAA